MHKNATGFCQKTVRIFYSAKVPFVDFGKKYEHSRFYVY